MRHFQSNGWESRPPSVCVCVRQQFALVQKSSARFSFTSCLYLILKSSVKLWTERPHWTSWLQWAWDLESFRRGKPKKRGSQTCGTRGAPAASTSWILWRVCLPLASAEVSPIKCAVWESAVRTALYLESSVRTAFFLRTFVCPAWDHVFPTTVSLV